MNEKEIDEWLAHSKQLVADLNQAIADYMRMVEGHGDPMTEASSIAFRKMAEAQIALGAI
jgi:hypothetical protein